MKKRSALLFALALLAPAPALADNWFATQWNGWRSHYRHNRDWPEQYLDQDRAAVRAPFAAMVANGWRSQNTISNYHFDDTSGELNDTGKLKVRAILTNAAPQYRSLYVLRADSPEMTGARVRAVQDYSNALMQGEIPPPVMVTNIEPSGISGEQIERTIRGRNDNPIPPILPAVQRPTEQ
jgi:hypothetical protein